MILAAGKWKRKEGRGGKKYFVWLESKPAPGCPAHHTEYIIAKKRVPNQIKRKKKCEKINSYIATYVLSPRPRAVGTEGTYAQEHFGNTVE